ncbi:cysteine-rich repeat secretory protein 55-like [Salvia miltiorrhiza]|uniref:cysteine-rich repeat secretory protein 55-like n=1 Tax=Salvia miltiorrhiza TaxID=226208 RepID=UPI0025AC4915|nr:cysteine-rich repeat secretory protein 55-like [Salvia miltiorrhiza]
MNLSSILLLITLSLYILTAESADPAANLCNNDSKANGTISRNIDTLLPKLVSGTIQNGFIATSYGGVYGLAQCRGDVSSSDCSSCIQDAAKEIRTLCPNQADARIWYDYCFLRYSTQKFFGGVDTWGVYLYNTQNVSDPEVFNKKLASLMDVISKEAVRTSSRGLGRGKTDVSEFVRLYALVQCTRDLSQINCAQCLAIAVSNFPTFCDNKRGCRVLYSSCYVRYELYPFFFPLDSHESLNSSSHQDKYERVMAVKN